MARRPSWNGSLASCEPSSSRELQHLAGPPAAWVYAQPAIGRRGNKQTVPLHTASGHISSRGPGSLSAGRSRSSSSLVRPQTSDWHGFNAFERSAKVRPRSGGFALKLARTVGSAASASSPSASVDSLRASTDERRRRMAHVSAIAAQAERAAAALREASQERDFLAEQVAKGEDKLRMLHENAVALERAVHTAIRQLDAAENAAALAEARAEALSESGEAAEEGFEEGARGVEAGSAGGGAAGNALRLPSVELEERAAQMLRQTGEQIARAFAEAEQQRGSSALSEAEAELAEAARAVVAALAAPAPAATAAAPAPAALSSVQGAPSPPRAPSARAGEGLGDVEQRRSEQPAEAPAAAPHEHMRPLYEARLAHAPWIHVDTLSWAVLLPAHMVSADGETDEDEEGCSAPRSPETAVGADGVAPIGEVTAAPPEEGSDHGPASASAGGAQRGEGTEGSGDLLRAVPIEALSRQHFALRAQLCEMQRAARLLEAEVREMAQASQFEQIDTDSDGLVTLADALPRAAGWGIPRPVLERAFSGAVLPLEGGRAAMDATDFARFVSWVEDGGQTKAGLRAWVRCLDLDGDGCIGPADLRWWYDALHAAAPAPTPQAALAAAALPTEPAAGEPTDGAIKPFANALGSQRAENHVDLGGADTPRIKPQAQSSEVPALAAAGDAAKAAEKGGSAGAEEAMVGNSTFSDLVCQLFDMASAGSHAHACSEASSVPKSRELMSALTFASLHRSKLAPAILQLLLSPQAPQSKG